MSNFIRVKVGDICTCPIKGYFKVLSIDSKTDVVEVELICNSKFTFYKKPKKDEWPMISCVKVDKFDLEMIKSKLEKLINMC